MSNEDFLNIGVKLRSERHKQKLSLRELAALADVSPSLLSQIENGRANPSVMTLHHVANALSVPITFFFPNPQESEPELHQVITSDKTPSEVRAENQTQFAVSTENNLSLSPIVNPASRLAIELMGGVRWERLTSTEEDGIQFLEIHYSPGATSGRAMSRHQGREFGVLLSGELKLELGFEQYTLVAGDSVIFDSNTPHRLTNAGTETVNAIWVIMNRKA